MEWLECVCVCVLHIDCVLCSCELCACVHVVLEYSGNSPFSSTSSNMLFNNNVAPLAALSGSTPWNVVVVTEREAPAAPPSRGCAAVHADDAKPLGTSIESTSKATVAAPSVC